MNNIPKPLHFNDLTVGDKVYCPKSDSYREVTEKITCSEGYLYTKLDGVLCGHYHSLYRTKEDYLLNRECAGMATKIWHSFDWGIVPPNITKEQLETIVGWIDGTNNI